MQNKNQYISFPFYIFISILLGTIGVFSVRNLWSSASLFYATLCIALFIFHIGLYWLNIKLCEKPRWWMFYYPVQTILVIALVNLPYGSDINLTILGSSILSLIGEALGLWGNTRRAFFLGLFYFGLMLVALYFLVERERLLLAISNLLLNGGFIVLLMVVLNQQLAERQKAMELAESLESANAKLAASAAKIESLTLQNERQRMARELHDTLAQGVAGLVLQLEAVKAHLASHRPERAAAIVDQSIARARSTLAESRAAIDDLRAASNNVVDAVKEKVERFTQATGIPCEMEISVNENQLSHETANHALNILSESLTNIARHAQATQVKVEFFIQNKTLELEVRDNGIGFDTSQNVSGHYGLVGMHERARLTGGSLVIESDANGTCVQFVAGRS
jgi:NarL family two-component system sensor histidine kinase YdfH